MSRTLVPALLIVFASSGILFPYAGVQTATRTPVVVELFTSEGCSSCPPADALLIRLEKLQPVANAQIIVLGQHVDYWNQLGWADPFSSALFSRRQSEYAEAFGRDGIYTPQMIVDGQAEFNGSDASRAQSAIARAAAQPKAAMTVSCRAGSKPQSLRVQVQIAATPQGMSAREAEVILAVTESNLANDVPRGENAGRKIQHTGVVRLLKSLGRVDAATASLEAEIQLAAGWKSFNLTVVAFAQERVSRRILGAATTKVAEE